LVTGPKRSVKSLLTQDQLLPGIGNGLAQDILFKARLHPRHPLDALDSEQQRALYDAIVEIVQQIVAQGGRSEEYDLFNRPGGYQRIMNKQAAGQPCLRCGEMVEKIQYLGGACYFCPACQV
jgi:formamidopyrimidine-DNA glycosylase